MSLLELPGTITSTREIATTFGAATFKMFHKPKAAHWDRHSAIFVSHGWQIYPETTSHGSQSLYCFAYLIAKKHSLLRTRTAADLWAAEAAQSFTSAPLAFAAAGIVGAVVVAHTESVDKISSEALAPALDYCDIVLFDALRFSEQRLLESEKMQWGIAEISREKKLTIQEKKERKRPPQDALAYYDNNGLPLAEILTAPQWFREYSNFVMHCCRPPWPPVSGTSTKSAQASADGLYAYDDAFHIMI